MADEDDRYPELVGDGRCELVIFPMGIGGLFVPRAVELLRSSASAKELAVPVYLRRATEETYHCRWSRVVAVAAAKAWASSVLVDEFFTIDDVPTHSAPWLLDVLSDAPSGGDFTGPIK